MPELQAVTELRRDVVEYAFYIEIAGLQHRWYSRTAPAVSAAHTDHRGLVSVSETTQSIDPLGGVEEAGSLTIEIARDVSGETTDAASILGRLGLDGAERLATLLQTLPQHATDGHTPPYGGTPEVWVNEDVTGWPTPGYAHIAGESLYYTGTAGTGGGGNPWRLTGVLRGQLGTLPDRHVVDDRLHWRGILTQPTCTWEGRRCTVRWQALAGDWVDYYDGILDAPPVIDASNIRLTVVPWAARLDIDIGSSIPSTQLVQGWAVIDGAAAYRVKCALAWPAGSAVAGENQAAWVLSQVLIGGGSVKVKGRSSREQHEAIYDIAAPAWGAAASPWHGLLRITIAGATELLIVDGYGPAAQELSFPPGDPPFQIEVDDLIWDVGGWLIHHVDLWDPASPNHDAGIGATVWRWPQDALAAINAAWSPGSNKFAGAASPMWADLAIVQDDEEGWVLQALGNHAVDTPGPWIILTTKRGIMQTGWRGGRALDFGDWFGNAAHLTYGLDFGDPEDEVHRSEPTWGNVYQGEPAAPWWHRRIMCEANRGAAGAIGHKIPIRGCASAWYQRGQRYLLVEDDIFTADDTWIGVDWTDPVTGDERVTGLRLAAATQYTHAVHGALGVLLDVSDPWVPATFGDWPTSTARVRLSPLVMWVRASSQRVLLDLLLSTRGDGINGGAYDAKPFGLAVPADAVDVGAFERAAVATGAQPWSFRLRPGSGGTVRSLIEPLLTASGLALTSVLNRNSGELRLQLVSVSGSPGAFDSADALAAFTLDAPPRAVIDDRVVNAVEFGGLAAPVRVESRDDIGAAGGHVQELRLDLGGLALAAADRSTLIEELRDIWSRVFDRSGQPRRLLEVEVDLAEAVTLHPGAVVTITYDGPGLVNLDGTTGLVERPCRVLEIEKRPLARTARLLLEPGERNVTGWAMAARVSGVVSAFEVEIEDNAYSEAAHPETGLPQRDVDFFAIGETALMHPLGAWSGASWGIVGVTTGSPATLDFVGAHGLAVGDSVEAAPYATASARQRLYAYLAGADNMIGADAGQLWR